MVPEKTQNTQGLIGKNRAELYDSGHFAPGPPRKPRTFDTLRRGLDAAHSRRTIVVMRHILSAALLLSTACTLPTATTVAVYPDAHELLPQIEAGADALNERLGAEVYVVVAIQSGDVIPGAAEVHLVDSISGGKDGYCTRTVGSGVQVLLTPDSPAYLVAHELGHAGGLGHDVDPTNLMHPVSPETWILTPAQVDWLVSL